MHTLSLSLLFCISCMVEYGLTQSTITRITVVNTPDAITPPVGTSRGPCDGCYIVANYSFETFFPSASGSDFTFGPSGNIINVSKTVYIVFNAYSVTSIVPLSGICSTISGTPITVSPSVSVVSPPNIATTVALPVAQSAFINRIGGLTCTTVETGIPLGLFPGASTSTTAPAKSVATIITPLLTPAVLTFNMSASTTTAPLTPTQTNITPTTSTSASSFTSPLLSSGASPPPTTSAPPSTGLSKGADAGIGVSIPLALFFLFVIGIFVRRCAKRRRATLERPHAELDSRERAELAAKQRRRELEAGDTHHELAVEEPQHELSGNRKSLRSSTLRGGQLVDTGLENK